MLSYIIPCYNSGRWIFDAVSSLYRQDAGEWEAILIDDCSSDNTADHIKLLNKLDPEHIKVGFHEKNMGQNPTKIDCINMSRGELIFALDHDNILSDNLMEKLIQHHHSTGHQAIATEEVLFFGATDQESLKIHGKWTLKHNSDWLCDFQQIVADFETPASDGNYLFTKEMYNATGGYLCHDVDLHGDWGFAFEHASMGYPIAIMPGTFYYHRYNPNGMYLSLDHRKLFKQYKTLLMKHITRFESASQLEIIKGHDGHELIQNGKLRVKK
jgi:glycosyltransferase involved in cell wall biosynthesis